MAINSHLALLIISIILLLVRYVDAHDDDGEDKVSTLVLEIPNVNVNAHDDDDDDEDKLSTTVPLNPNGNVKAHDDDDDDVDKLSALLSQNPIDNVKGHDNDDDDDKDKMSTVSQIPNGHVKAHDDDDDDDDKDKLSTPVSQNPNGHVKAHDDDDNDDDDDDDDDDDEEDDDKDKLSTPENPNGHVKAHDIDDDDDDEDKDKDKELGSISKNPKEPPTTGIQTKSTSNANAHDIEDKESSGDKASRSTSQNPKEVLDKVSGSTTQNPKEPPSTGTKTQPFHDTTGVAYAPLAHLPHTVSTQPVIKATVNKIEKKMKLSVQKTEEIMRVVKKRIEETPGTTMAEDCLKTCIEVYAQAIDGMKKSVHDLSSGNYYKVNIDISAVSTDVETCEECYTEMLGEDPELKKFDKWLQGVTSECLDDLQSFSPS